MIDRRPLAGVIVLMAFAGPPALAQDGAQDGYAHAPFREHPVALAQAAALERLEMTARALSAIDDDADDDDDDDDDAAPGDHGEEEEGDLLATVLPLVRGSLAAARPDLAQNLARETGAMLEGEDTAGHAEAVLGLMAEVRAAILPAEVTDTVPFRAAVMASLLLDEGGVAESYEEAAAEDEAYAIGAAALGRVHALWEGLKGQGGPGVAEGDAALARLDALFPAERPERLSPDPEEAEAPAQALVGVAEVVTDTDLYPGRDLAGAAAGVADITRQACAAHDPALGRQDLAIAAAWHDQILASALGVLAPEVEEVIAEGLADDEAEGDASDDTALPDCAPLLAALDQARAVLTP